jgi:hypothetical protein
MSPVLDKSQSPEFSEPYRLLAPLVLLSFPSGIALPSLRPSEAPRSWRRLAAESVRSNDNFVRAPTPPA